MFARATKYVNWIRHESRKFMMEVNGEDICSGEDIPESDCYNGCVVSHIPFWGASSGDKTPITGGNWVCTEGGNSCNYFCDDNNQDTGIETSCIPNDAGDKEWREPRVRKKVIMISQIFTFLTNLHDLTNLHYFTNFHDFTNFYFFNLSSRLQKSSQFHVFTRFHKFLLI